jgi:agmatine deiminase
VWHYIALLLLTHDLDDCLTRFYMSQTARSGEMPAEWQEHECTWMIWPATSKRMSTWHVPGISLVRECFTQVALTIATFEPITIIANNPADLRIAESHFSRCNRSDYPISFYVFEVDDLWVRDTGPTFLTNTGKSELKAVSWVFNGWGEKLKQFNETYTKDAQVAARIAHLSTPAVSAFYNSPLTIEGGSIHCDGEGTLLVAETSVINDNRNPGWAKQEVEIELLRVLGAEVRHHCMNHPPKHTPPLTHIDNRK